tara:strand:+ start:188 stop:694 length:507 start_codon:yes stop_codon:yes gene_type:complete
VKILAGRFKGLSVHTSSKMAYRPTKSRVRKSIFDRLQNFNFKSTLDLFSGSGIIGFESASRGATEVTFVENNVKIMNQLRKNSELFNDVKFRFNRVNVLLAIQNLDNFDFIYADPPYGEIHLQPLSETILKHLNKDGIFILECEKNQIPFLDADVYDYGNTRILTWKN